MEEIQKILEFCGHYKHDTFTIQNVFFCIWNVETNGNQRVENHLFTKVEQVEDGLENFEIFLETRRGRKKMYIANL
ncbi:hypothetical protein B9Z55_009025 [Caenorhabditis nigoni]|uniref:Uncharacterized protein n=1 Tax=Caenorhabditis nigoni TaxID=1611254 RepID=A0A2G5UQQ3_9PELO|nr:hypothetical protein B9Z55_009025 [Caenorhabditis nigoni]